MINKGKILSSRAGGVAGMIGAAKSRRNPMAGSGMVGSMYKRKPSASLSYARKLAGGIKTSLKPAQKPLQSPTASIPERQKAMPTKLKIRA
jgi:hypothetical protein